MHFGFLLFRLEVASLLHLLGAKKYSSTVGLFRKLLKKRLLALALLLLIFKSSLISLNT